MARVCSGAPFKKRVNPNPSNLVLIMKLFVCLALFSLSSAEPLFRLPLHPNKSVRSHMDQVDIPVEVVFLNRKSNDSAPFPKPLSTFPDAHNVYKRQAGIGFSVAGACTISPGSNDVKNAGSGDCYITYGNCGSSGRGSSNGGGYWVHDVYNAGSGKIFITYCSASTSSAQSNGESLINNLHNAGSGKIYINYECGASASSGGRKLLNDIFNGGSSQVHITYRDCCSSTSGNNVCGGLLNNIHGEGSGIIDIKYSTCGACGIMMNDIINGGSSKISITYRSSCPSGASSGTNSCGKMFNNIRSGGSGILDLKYYECESAPRNTNNCGILGRDVNNAGSANVYLTYSGCNGKLVDSVHDASSGNVFQQLGRCRRSASRARRNTNIGGKLDKMLAEGSN